MAYRDLTFEAKINTAFNRGLNEFFVDLERIMIFNAMGFTSPVIKPAAEEASKLQMEMFKFAFPKRKNAKSVLNSVLTMVNELIAVETPFDFEMERLNKALLDDYDNDSGAALYAFFTRFEKDHPEDKSVPSELLASIGGFYEAGKVIEQYGGPTTLEQWIRIKMFLHLLVFTVIIYGLNEYSRTECSPSNVQDAINAAAQLAGSQSDSFISQLGGAMSSFSAAFIWNEEKENKCKGMVWGAWMLRSWLVGQMWWLTTVAPPAFSFLFVILRALFSRPPQKLNLPEPEKEEEEEEEEEQVRKKSRERSPPPTERPGGSGRRGSGRRGKASAQLPAICARCPKAADLVCTACNAVSYCSPQCQANHWTDHKQKCSA